MEALSHADVKQVAILGHGMKRPVRRWKWAMSSVKLPSHPICDVRFDYRRNYSMDHGCSRMKT